MNTKIILVLLMMLGVIFHLSSQSLVEIDASAGNRAILDFGPANPGFSNTDGYRLSWNSSTNQLDFRGLDLVFSGGVALPSFVTKMSLSTEGYLGVGAQKGENLLFVKGAGTTFGSPMKFQPPSNGFTEVVGYFENTLASSHTAITISGNPGNDAIIYLAQGGGLPLWDIRNDFSDNNELQFRWQGQNAENNIRMRLTDTGNLIIDGTLTEGSDVNNKEIITPISNEEILDKLVTVPITEWQYKGTSERHIGPMAQDFYKTFGLGFGETTISNVDKDGINMAAIQALYDRVVELENQNDILKSYINKEIRDLKNKMSKISEDEE